MASMAAHGTATCCCKPQTTAVAPTAIDPPLSPSDEANDLPQDNQEDVGMNMSTYYHNIQFTFKLSILLFF